MDSASSYSILNDSYNVKYFHPLLLGIRVAYAIQTDPHCQFYLNKNQGMYYFSGAKVSKKAY
jgi:hypothetical protein